MSATASMAPAEVFPLSEYLRDELEENGWTVAQFAQIIGRPVQVVSEILNDRKAVTEETAQEIATATGTEAATWLGLQTAYNLWKLSQEEAATSRLTAVSRRARLNRLVPLAELRKRKLVHESDLDAQEQDVKKLLRVSTLDATPDWSVAARRSGTEEDLSPLQWTWVACVRAAAAACEVQEYRPTALRELAERLTTTITDERDIARIPDLFTAVGVKVVYVPPFASAKMDGVAMLEEGIPVIGMSGRLQGLDSVLYTLLHECAHILRGHVRDGITLDTDIQNPLSEEREQEADELAARWVLSGVVTVPSRVSTANVRAESRRLGVHPAVIIGQLRHQGKVPYTHFHALVPKVRKHLEDWNSY